MRLATRIALTLAVLASMAPPAARLATAQLTDVYHDGMIHQLQVVDVNVYLFARWNAFEFERQLR